ncbi:MAG: DUF4250 domain-containing protein [Clostridiales bacterium]|nr:DUF4250 domain-containing protein [Clostridiales bacterium]
MLPQDNFILLSFINTKLRDEYSSLQDFCEKTDEDAEEICVRLQSIGYYYNEELNAFK